MNGRTKAEEDVDTCTILQIFLKPFPKNDVVRRMHHGDVASRKRPVFLNFLILDIIYMKMNSRTRTNRGR